MYSSVSIFKNSFTIFLNSLIKQRSDFSFYCFSLFLAVVVALIFYPGCFSYDSLSQLSQADSQNYSTWHPVIMALSMHYIDKLFGVGGLLIFHQFFYWLAISIIVSVLFKNRLIYLLIGFFPPIFMLNLSMWKDIGMNTSFLFAIASILSVIRSEHFKFWSIIALISIIYGCLVRLNGITIGVFLLLLLVIAIHKRLNKHWLYSVGKFVVFALILAVSSPVINKLTQANKSYPASVGFLWDIAGIYVHSNGRLSEFPNELSFLIRPNEKSDHWLEAYHPFSCNICWSSISGIKCITENEEQFNVLFKTWLNLVIDNPKEYLKHRLALSKYILSFSGNAYYPYHNYELNDNSDDIRLRPNDLAHKSFQLFNYVYQVFSYTKLNLVYIWILVSVVVFCFSNYLFIFKKRCEFKTIFLILVSASSISSTFALLIKAPAADYRYMIWAITSGILVLFGQFSNKLSEIDKY